MKSLPLLFTIGFHRLTTIAVAMMGRAIERKILKKEAIKECKKLIINEAKKLRAKTIVFSKSIKKCQILPK